MNQHENRHPVYFVITDNQELSRVKLNSAPLNLGLSKDVAANTPQFGHRQRLSLLMEHFGKLFSKSQEI